MHSNDTISLGLDDIWLQCCDKLKQCEACSLCYKVGWPNYWWDKNKSLVLYRLKSLVLLVE